MAAVAYPESWAEAGLEDAVFSDPAPVRAVLAAIHERESLFHTSDFDNNLPPIELVRFCAPEARRNTGGMWWQIVREVPNRILASAIYQKIQRLSTRFVDMDYDYAARDWTEFPVMLSARFDRGEHPMAWCPDYCDPELDDACVAWRRFLADARWWLDRMTVVPVANGDYRFGRRHQLSGDYSRTVNRPGTEDESVYEYGTPISDILDAQPSSSSGSYQNANNSRKLGAFVRLEIELNSTLEWSSNTYSLYIRSESHVEDVSATVHSDLRVRNRFPCAATLLLVACGGGRVNNTQLTMDLCKRTRSVYSIEFNEPEEGQSKSVVSAEEIYEEAWQPLSSSGAEVYVYRTTERTIGTGTQTTTGWAHDWSDSLSRTESVSPGGDPGYNQYNPPTVYDDTRWTAYPRPGLLGLPALGPNDAGTLAAGARTDNLLPFVSGFDGVDEEEFWQPEELTGNLDCSERRLGSVTFGVVVLPVLDFSISFRFKADAQVDTP